MHSHNEPTTRNAIDRDDKRGNILATIRGNILLSTVMSRPNHILGPFLGLVLPCKHDGNMNISLPALI